jgi:hypothetical protein
MSKDLGHGKTHCTDWNKFCTHSVKIYRGGSCLFCSILYRVFWLGSRSNYMILYDQYRLALNVLRLSSESSRSIAVEVMHDVFVRGMISWGWISVNCTCIRLTYTKNLYHATLQIRIDTCFAWHYISPLKSFEGYMPHFPSRLTNIQYEWNIRQVDAKSVSWSSKIAQCH